MRSHTLIRMTPTTNKAAIGDNQGKRTEEIASLFFRGESQHAIGARLGVSQATVSRVLGEFLRGLQTSFTEELDRCRAVELGKLCEVERAAWAGYEATQNAKFLNAVTSVVALRCRILGVERPSEVSVKVSGFLSRDQMAATIKQRLAAFKAQQV